MAIVPCPQCAKSMEQDDGFCGSCGAVIDADLLDTTIDDADPPTSPSLTAPDFELDPLITPRTDPARMAVVAAVDLGGFDERTDIVPPPLDDLPHQVPPAVAMPAPAPPVVVEKPADAFQSFLEENTGAFSMGVFEEETGSHRVDRQAMVQPQVVLKQKPGVDVATLSPFEQHVLSFLDGRRPLARLRKKAGLAFADLKVAIGMLADRGVIEVVGVFKPDVRSLLEEDDLADSGPHPTIPQAPPPPPRPAPAAPPRPAPSPLPGQAARPHGVMPLPGQGGAPPRTKTPPPKPPPPAPVRPSANDPAARAHANLLLERALAEQRAGKRQAAIALMHMAAELLPGDPRIEELRRALLAR